MRERLFLLLILLLTTTSFFWEDEQKVINQLHQNGEAAWLKNDFDAAKKAFEELLGRISVIPSQKYQVNWQTYIEVITRLAQIYDELGQTEESKKILASALAKKPPPELTCRVKLIQARIFATSEAPAEAYLEMKQIAQLLPIKKWPVKEASFFHALQQNLDAHYDGLVRKAKLHLTAGLYPEATLLYEEINQAIEKGCYPKVKHDDTLLAQIIRYRLAECFYLNANYEKSLSLLGSGPNILDPQMIYLSALCYKEKKDFEKALELFQNYVNLADMADLEHYDHALYEMGHYWYQRNQIAKAQCYFERLLNFNRKPTQLGILLLARIYLEKGQSEKVEALLKPLTETLKTQDPLQYECFYLRGLAAFEERDYPKAKDYFERSLPCKNPGKWSCHSLYYLGWCYTKLGEDCLKSDEVRHRFFTKAEETFNALIKTPMREEACLSLAQVYIIIFRQFNQPEMKEKFERLLQQQDSLSIQGQLEALLLKSEMSNEFLEKENLLNQATAPRFQRTPLYSQAWYFRGWNFFQRGISETQLRHHFLDEAASAFEKGMQWIDQKDRNLVNEMAKMEGKTHLCRMAWLSSLNAFDRILSQFNEKSEHREEILYLKGLVAAHLPSSTYFSLAEDSFNQIINQVPESPYRSQALFALGTLYYRKGDYEKGKDLFCQLAEEHPDTPFAPEGWFWAAEAANLIGENPMGLRRHVYEEYPTSHLAAEAYFRQFPYVRYVEGGSEVIHHIKGFFHKFNNSPLEVAMYYFLGLHEEVLEMAQLAFEKSIASFVHYHKISQIPFLSYFYYRAQLELAVRLPLDEGERMLSTLVADLAQKEHPLAGGYLSIYEEGEFRLFQCYLKQGKEGFAQKKLQEMLHHYDRIGIREGYYLSQVWLEQGKLAMSCHDYDTALNCFEMALGCSPNNDEQHLNIWLQQSACYREKKEYDQAMRLLSKVINAETASPLRLKAMYLRAEIYELADRPELAIRQLEAMTKKGGEWAALAKEKLELLHN